MSESDNEYYDELKAYKIVADMYQTQKVELKQLEYKFESCEKEEKEIEEEIKDFKRKEESDEKVFFPNSKNSIDDEIARLKGKKNDLEEKKKFLHERIIATRELVAEYSFVMSALKDKQIESEQQKRINEDLIDILIDKIMFCRSIAMVDPLRTSEELEFLYNLLIQSK